MGKQIITVVDAPEITLTENETAGDALLKFYRAIGWNGEDMLDPCKVRTTKAVFEHLHDVMRGKCTDSAGVGMILVNSGPGTDDYVPHGKVYLLENWVTPAEPEKGRETHGN